MHKFVFLLVSFFVFLFLSTPQVFADTISLEVATCDVNDNPGPCQTALEADGGGVYGLPRSRHIDASLDTLTTATSINSATLYYDSYATLSGSWAIYLKDARDGTTICSVDPAPEDATETSNSVGCTVTPTQLSDGVWVQIDNNDTGTAETVYIDYVYLYVDYNTAASVSISLSTDGSVSLGTLAENTTVDTTSGGVNDTETITVDTGPADIDIRSTAFSDGSNTWSLGGSSGSNQVLWEFSPDGTSWSTFSVVDTLYSLATNIAESSSQDVFFRLTTPTTTSSYAQHSATITVVASSP